MKTNQERIEKLRADRMLDREDFRALLTGLSPEEEALLYKEARSVREEIYGKEVYLRGLVEPALPAHKRGDPGLREKRI